MELTEINRTLKNSSGCWSRHFESHDYITSVKDSFSINHASTIKIKKCDVPTLFLDHEETSWKEDEEIQVVMHLFTYFILNY